MIGAEGSSFAIWCVGDQPGQLEMLSQKEQSKTKINKRSSDYKRIRKDVKNAFELAFVLVVCVYLCDNMCILVQCPRRPEKGIGPLVTGVRQL